MKLLKRTWITPLLHTPFRMWWRFSVHDETMKLSLIKHFSTAFSPIENIHIIRVLKMTSLKKETRMLLWSFKQQHKNPRTKNQDDRYTGGRRRCVTCSSWRFHRAEPPCLHSTLYSKTDSRRHRTCRTSPDTHPDTTQSSK